MADPEGLGEFVDRHDGGIALALFDAADVLLAEARELGQAFLAQALFLPDPLHVPADELAHIHARSSPDYIFYCYQL